MKYKVGDIVYVHTFNMYYKPGAYKIVEIDSLDENSPIAVNAVLPTTWINYRDFILINDITNLEKLIYNVS